MKYFCLAVLLSLSACGCMVASDHPPQKRPDFSVPREKIASVTSESCGCGCKPKK